MGAPSLLLAAFPPELAGLDAAPPAGWRSALTGVGAVTAAATTVLLLLYVWPFPRLRWWMLAGHLVVVASVFLSHLHYTIDVIGGYAMAFSLFCLREVELGPALGAKP